MIELCLTNLGKYNEGELVYTRLVLPDSAEEIETAFDKIGVAEKAAVARKIAEKYDLPLSNKTYINR